MAIRDLIRRGSGGAPARGQSWLEPFRALQQEMNRTFEDFLAPLGRTLLSERGGMQMFGPKVDVREDKNSIEVTAELPGLSEKDLKVELAPSRDALTIRGEKRDEREKKEGGYHYSERTFGSFLREVDLPAPVRDENIDAKFKNGVLTIKLPKSGEQEGGRKLIEVKSS